LAVIDFILTVILVTASGAFAPGPLFFGTLIHGTKTGVRAGIWSALGHMTVEFPLVLVLALGLLNASAQPVVRQVISLLGGAALLIFGGFQLRDAWRGKRSEVKKNQRLPANSLALGIVFTAFNPFFVIWWLTIGSKLVFDALLFASLAGVLLMYASHVWMDYAFLGAGAYVARKGSQFIGSRGFRALLAVFGLVMIYFGVNFVVQAIV
jgi:threonine/homoserine/homoserine lactone efflux protein